MDSDRPRRAPSMEIAILAVVAIVGVLLFLELRRRSAMEADVARMRAESAAALRASPGAAPVAELQLPKIVVGSDPKGLAVTLENDTPDREVVLDPLLDALVVDFETSRGVESRKIPLGGAVLRPGEAAPPVLVPVEAGWKPVRVRLEHRVGNGVHTTELKLP